MKYKCDLCGKPTDNIYHRSDYMNADYIERYGDKEYHICDECQEREYAILDWQNEQLRELSVICPWCGKNKLTISMKANTQMMIWLLVTRAESLLNWK